MMLSVLGCGRGIANIPDGDDSLERPPPPKRWTELTSASQGLSKKTSGATNGTGIPCETSSRPHRGR
jgi:hypothetical protein